MGVSAKAPAKVPDAAVKAAAEAIARLNNRSYSELPDAEVYRMFAEAALVAALPHLSGGDGR